MLETIASALALVLSGQHLFHLGIGVLMGLAVGVFPGLGGIAGLSLLLPFLYGMDEVSGLAMMVGLIAVIPTSDTFTSILMGIPGSAASQATVIDGFPLAKKGQAARALSAAFAASLFGGLFGAVVLTFFILGARPIILAFRTPELLMLTVLGFSMVGVLSGRSLYKGIATAGLGMLIGSIGAAPAQASARMSFGSWYLSDGLELVIIGLGIFALPEIVSLLRSNRAIAEERGLGSGWLQGLKDSWANLWLILRCSVLGVIIGILPGLGGSASGWLAYGHTVQTTRDRPNFGKGDIRGIIGPESSNNANDGGALVPTLLFGIPGSGGMAVFLGGMTLLGMEAGPSMIELELDVTYSIVWSLTLANVLGTGLCILLAPPIAKLTTVRFAILAPFMFMAITFAAFQSKQTLWDLVALLSVGVLGLYMKRFDWPRPAFLIGFVLSDQAEVYTYQVVQFTQHQDIWYLLTPTVGIIAAVIVVSVWLGARQSASLRGTDGVIDSAGDIRAKAVSRAPQAIFAALIILFAAYTAYDAFQLSVFIDKVFPIAVAGIVLPLAGIVLYRTLRACSTDPVIWDDEVQGEDTALPGRRGVWQTLSWFGGLLAITSLIGFFTANTAFFLLFLRHVVGLSWTRTIVFTSGASAALLYFAWLLNRDFPAGLLQQVADLPWPFR